MFRNIFLVLRRNHDNNQLTSLIDEERLTRSIANVSISLRKSIRRYFQKILDGLQILNCLLILCRGKWKGVFKVFISATLPLHYFEHLIEWSPSQLLNRGRSDRCREVGNNGWWVGSDLNCLTNYRFRRTPTMNGRTNCQGTGRRDRSHCTLTARSLIDFLTIRVTFLHCTPLKRLIYLIFKHIHFFYYLSIYRLTGYTGIYENKNLSSSTNRNTVS